MPLIQKDFVVARLNAKHWATRRPVVYKARDRRIEIPRGFVTDFASVPRIFMSLFPSTGAWTIAATMHDYLLLMIGSGRRILNSNDADGMFRRIAREEGVDVVTRWAMWTGVRWGALFSRDGYRRPGWFAWGNFWKVAVWSIVLLPAIVPVALGVGLGLLWLGLLRLIAWGCRLR